MIEIPEHLLAIEDPFFVCSRSVLISQVDALKGLGMEVFYSTKTNPEMAILKELQGKVGFSVSSPEEFISVMAMGGSADEIIYYERGLNNERVSWLIGAGCKNFVVECMKGFENIITEAKEDFTIFVRIKSESVGNKYSGNYAPGFSIEETRDLIGKCKALGIKVGVLHHSSSQVDEPSAWEKKFELLGKLDGLDVINLGGGLPIDYNDKNSEKILKEIEKGVKGLKAKRVIIEPGRFIVGPACSLVAKAVLVDGKNVVLNCSVYNAHIDTIIADLTLPCRTLGIGSLKEYTLLGSSLCNLDVFDAKAKLPEIKEKDSIIFDYAGAYNFSSDFGSGSGIETYIVD